MLEQYLEYTHKNFQAFCEFQRTAELVNRKKTVLDKLLIERNIDPVSYLFVGFNPWIFTVTPGRSAALLVHDVEQRAWFAKNRPDITLYSSIPDGNKYNAVIATDEIMTFFLNDNEQQKLCRELIEVCSGIVVTTMRDYKNMDIKDREFSYPISIKTNNNVDTVYLEHYKQKSNFQWTTNLYKLNEKSSGLIGTFERRAVYFKQMAKFFTDAGSRDFYMHKNLWHKNLIKKNFEHLISIKI